MQIWGDKKVSYALWHLTVRWCKFLFGILSIQFLIKHDNSEATFGFHLMFFFLLALQPPLGVLFYSPLAALASSLTRFLDLTQRRATVDRTPLDEWWVRRRDLYLTTHNTHNRQTSMPRVGFEPTISAGERPKIYALDRAATGTGTCLCYFTELLVSFYRVAQK